MPQWNNLSVEEWSSYINGRGEYLEYVQNLLSDRHHRSDRFYEIDLGDKGAERIAEALKGNSSTKKLE
jgi:hypothetical protein